MHATDGLLIYTLKKISDQEIASSDHGSIYYTYDALQEKNNEGGSKRGDLVGL